MPIKAAALFISPEAPYPPHGGGALRSASLIEYLARRYTLDVVVFREEAQPDPAPAFPPGLVNRIRVITIPKHSKALPFRALRNLDRLIRGVPPLVDRFRGFERQLEFVLDGGRYELAVLEHFWSAQYHAVVSKRSRRIVLDLHNIESEWHRRSADAEPWPASAGLHRFARACERLERELLGRFDLLLTPSEREAEHLSTVAPVATTVVYPNAIPLVPKPLIAPDHSIVFSGNLEYRPNLQAVRYFRDGVWPRLKRMDPKLKWRLAGRNPQAAKALVGHDPRIEVLGPMVDSIATLASSKVAVVPVLSGSGTRMKILEAWAAGVPVVSTKLGAEGLDARDGEHLLIAEDATAFTMRLRELLQDERRRAELAAKGRELYEAKFTWQSAWRSLESRL